MTSECEKWTEISDRVALEEQLSDSDRTFLQVHAASCDLCEAEQRVWESLGACLDEADAQNEERPTQCPVEHVSPTEPARPQFRSVYKWAGGVAAAAAAVALFSLIGSERAAETDAGELSATVASQGENTRSFAQFLLVSGDVKMEGSKPSAGASLDEADTIRTKEGRACLTHGGGTTTCLEKQSRARILEARSGAQRLELSAGTLYTRQPNGSDTEFEVKTRWGTIVGVGAQFLTAYTADGTVSVSTLAGKVHVRHARGSEQVLQARERASLSAAGVSTLQPSPAGSNQTPYEHMAFWDEASLTPVALTSEPEGALLKIDGVLQGKTPLSMMMARGAHRLEITLEGYDSLVNPLEVRGAERVTEKFALQSASSDEVPPTAVAPSAAELLARAQASRKRGQFSEAARAYQTILSLYPASREATATRLSLAELQLSQLGAPSAALASFRQYLRTGGALQQEASYGEIRSLRALGRSGEARSLAEKFIATYPQSGQAVSLERWLGSSKKSLKE